MNGPHQNHALVQPLGSRELFTQPGPGLRIDVYTASGTLAISTVASPRAITQPGLQIQVPRHIAFMCPGGPHSALDLSPGVGPTQDR